MLAALKTGPLAGCDVSLNHVAGNWSDTAALAKVLAGVPADAILAATSEGGLFEYGSDSDIAGVLNTLAPRIDVVTGSVTRNAEINRLMRLHSRVEHHPARPVALRRADRADRLSRPQIGERDPQRSGAADEILTERRPRRTSMQARHHACRAPAISAVGGTRSGTITVCMPGAHARRARPNANPRWRGSRRASTPSCRAAVRYGSGCGLGWVTSSRVTIAWNMSSSPAVPRCLSACGGARRGGDRHRDAARLELGEQLRARPASPAPIRPSAPCMMRRHSASNSS